MKIVTSEATTLIAFNDTYTEATLTRIQGRTYKVKIPNKHFTVQKLEQFVNLHDDIFIGLAQIQKRRSDK